MGYPTLSTIGLVMSERIVLVILDNGTYGSPDRQPTTASAPGVA